MRPTCTRQNVNRERFRVNVPYISKPDDEDDDAFGFLESSLEKSESNSKLSQILKEWKTQAGGLASRRFDAKNPPPPVIPIYKLNGQTICTPGNLTVIAAHDKAGKSGLVGGFIAASFGREGDCLGIKSNNPEELAVVHFDTEQTPGDHFARVMKALSRVGLDEAPPWLRSYYLLDVDRSKRFELLERELNEAYEEHGGIHSVFLDGSVDLIKSPNSEEESLEAVHRLVMFAAQFKTDIICTIHFNPGTEYNKTRGHFGSELARKAETNLKLVKDPNNISTVFTTNSRHCCIPKDEGIRFCWDDQTEMHVSCGSKQQNRENLRREAEAELVGKVYDFIKGNPNASKRALRSLGNSDCVDKSLDLLTTGGYIEVDSPGKGKRNRYAILKPYRSAGHGYQIPQTSERVPPLP